MLISKSSKKVSKKSERKPSKQSKRKSKKQSRGKSKRKSKKGGAIRRVKKEPVKEQKVETDEDIKKHNEKVVVEYVTKVRNHLKEKQVQTFHIIADKDSTGFKNKIKGMISTDFKKVMKANPKKYAGKIWMMIGISTHLPTDKKSELINLYEDIYLTVSISNPYRIDEKGVPHNLYMQGTKISWKLDDFKITKFSFALVEKLMIMVLEGTNFYSLTGVPIHELIQQISWRKKDILKYLEPLPGLK